MTFTDITAGSSVFVDANVLIYAYGPHPVLGTPCQELLKRLENNDVVLLTSTHVLAEMVHRLMGMEASRLFGWGTTGSAPRMKAHPREVQQLSLYRRSYDDIVALGVRILPLEARHGSLAVDVSGQFGLLSGDALVVAVMKENQLSQLASNDADFDRVPGIQRFSPT